ncbi:hypothetical protein [Actinoplanes sp. NPDC089786]|uniref:hypothetical protein n=1 Tax=Actinoplanes sp. NPDC089786 TaxID=3155185 RepID=UPI0034316503
MQLIALPEDTPIGVQIGDQHLDAVSLTPWGDEGFVDLQCHSSDLLDVLLEWNLPAQQREQIVAAANNASPPEQRSVMAELLTALEKRNLQTEPGRWLLPGTPP